MADRDAVRAYYRALDDHHYDAFEAFLTPSFVHQRPDRTLEGREAFVTFMREKRPLSDTTHDLQDLYENDAGDEIVARGTLLDADGEALFDFLDRHVFASERIDRLETYSSR